LKGGQLSPLGKAIANANIYKKGADTFAKTAQFRSGWSLSGGRLLYILGRLSDTRDPESLLLLRDMIEFEALPELSAINTIDDFVAHRSNDPENSQYFFADPNLLARIAIVKGRS
jgi:hypothetical protein